MLPIFIGLMSGGWFSNWLDSILKPQSQEDSILALLGGGGSSYKSHIVSDSVLNVKFGIEESYKLKTTAYQDSVGVWTIGIGLVNIFNSAGKFVVKVSKGMTLLRLKQIMGLTSMSDLAFCFQLMRNHVKTSKTYTVYADLDNNKIPYNDDLADSIVDFYYNSGSAYGKSHYKTFIADLKKVALGGGDMRKGFAVAYVKYRLSYLESWSSVMYGSWLRRTLIFADRIAKSDKTFENKKSWAKFPTSSSLKNYALNEYGYSVIKRVV